MLYYKIKITATNPNRTVERQIVTELVTKHCVHVLGGEQDTQAAKTSSPSHLWAVGQQRWGVLRLAGEKPDRSPAALGMTGAPWRLALAGS